MPETCAVYELDDRGEADGIVHPYCSPVCLTADLPNVPLPRFIATTDDLDGFAPDTRCEGCGAVVVADERTPDHA